MAVNDLLPVDRSVDRETEPRVVNVDEDGDVVDVLATGTAREILDHLYEEPGPASEIADVVGTSLQNVQYHLSRLEEADLVKQTTTWYSAKGREMDVYAPASGPLILFAGDSRSESTVTDVMADRLAESASD